MELIRVSTPHQTIPLGIVGENTARRVEFTTIYYWYRLYGETGVPTLLVQRAGDEQPYPAALTIDPDDKGTYWIISNVETNVAGYGKAELQFHVGETLVKSETYTFVVKPALSPASEEIPEPAQSWVDQVLAAGASAQAAAKQVEEEISHLEGFSFEINEEGHLILRY